MELRYSTTQAFKGKTFVGDKMDEGIMDAHPVLAPKVFPALAKLRLRAGDSSSSRPLKELTGSAKRGSRAESSRNEREWRYPGGAGA